MKGKGPSGPVQKLARNLNEEEGKLNLEFGKGQRVFEREVEMPPQKDHFLDWGFVYVDVG